MEIVNLQPGNNDSVKDLERSQCFIIEDIEAIIKAWNITINSPIIYLGSICMKIMQHLIQM